MVATRAALVASGGGMFRPLIRGLELTATQAGWAPRPKAGFLSRRFIFLSIYPLTTTVQLVLVKFTRNLAIHQMEFPGRSQPDTFYGVHIT